MVLALFMLSAATVSGCAGNMEEADAPSIYPGAGDNKGGYGGVKAYFEYNESDRLYYRFQHGGEHIDDLDGSQLAVSNVVIVTVR